MKQNLVEKATEAMWGMGQPLEDALVNTSVSGCFEYCDGWPVEQLGGEDVAILVEAISLDGKTSPDPAATEALSKRIDRYAQIAGDIHAVCRSECPGAYTLFDDKKDMDDKAGNAVKRECPKKTRFAELVINFGLGADT